MYNIPVSMKTSFYSARLFFSISPGSFHWNIYIILNVIVNIPSGSSFTSYLFGIVSPLYLESFLSFLLPFFGNPKRAFADIFFFLGLHYISWLYYYSINIHCNNISVLIFYMWFFMLGVHFNLWTNKILQKSFKASTEIIGYFPVAL